MKNLKKDDYSANFKISNCDEDMTKQIKYEKPEIKKVNFSTQSTTVLGNCSGWKSTDMLN